MNKNKLLNSYDMVSISMLVALTAVFSQISISLGPIPINFALIPIFIIGGILNWYKAAIGVMIYILLGLVGVPVFAGLKSGFGTLSGPTGGYIIGYIFVALITALGFKFFKSKVYQIMFMILGLLMCYTFGTVWFIIIMKTTLWNGLLSCVFPFLPGDALKIVISFIVINRIRKIFYKNLSE